MKGELSRVQALAAINVGDLIFGIRDDGHPDLLLVKESDATTFLARNVFNQTSYRFGRDGEGRRVEDDRTCTIVSIARMTSEQYDVAIALDRRMASRPEYPDSRMTEDEVQLVLTHDKFFRNQLLPGTESLVEHAERLRAVQSILDIEWDRMDERGSPRSLGEYEDDLPALLAVLEQGSPEDAVAQMLFDICVSHERPSRVMDRTTAAAASLVRLAQTWT